jgi:hypothetical protein
MHSVFIFRADRGDCGKGYGERQRGSLATPSIT